MSIGIIYIKDLYINCNCTNLKKYCNIDRLRADLSMSCKLFPMSKIAVAEKCSF